MIDAAVQDNRDIALLFGNGIVHDYVKYCKNHPDFGDNWDPSAPTRWSRAAQIQDVDPYIRDVGALLNVNYFPYFFDFVRKCRDNHPEISDFDIFKALTAENIDEFYREYITAEACHFLAIAYSFFFHKAQRPCYYGGWQWISWIAKYKDRLSAVTSFNYDLTVEIALAAAHVFFSRAGIAGTDTFALWNARAAYENGMKNGSYRLPVVKPHGSVDYGNFYDYVKYPLEIPARFRNATVNVILETELRLPRSNVEFVLPAEFSRIGRLSWVEEGSKAWESATKHTKHLVIVGLSYWECDRSELDSITDRFDSETKIYMVNPCPSPEWKSRLKAKFGNANYREYDGKCLNRLMIE